METPENKEGAGIEIVEATVEDVHGILNVQKETWLATYPNKEFGITEEDILSKDFDDPERVTRWEKRVGEGSLWVAKEMEKVVGFAIASKNEKENEIRAIYILPDHQGKGVGKKLMAKLFAYLGEDKPISLTVASYNKKAIAFYKSLGFKGETPVSPSRAASLPSGKIIPEIEMTLDFSKK